MLAKSYYLADGIIIPQHLECSCADFGTTDVSSLLMQHPNDDGGDTGFY